MTTLTAIRAALQGSASEHAAFFASLLDKGQLTTWKSLSSSARQFGAGENDCVNFGKKQSSFGTQKLPTIEELQEICIRDLINKRTLCEDLLAEIALRNRTQGAEHVDDETAIHFINNLVDTTSDATRGVLTFPSEALHEWCNKGLPIPENILRTAMTKCTILAGNTFLPLQYTNEGTTITTLLSGTLVWTIWPSTPHNLSTLETAYRNYAQDSSETHLATALPALQNGIVFVQEPGEGIRIPPLCPILCLSTTNAPAILSTSSQFTVPHFLNTLHHLPLLQTFYAATSDAHAFSEFKASLLRYLDLLLNGDSDDSDGDALRLPAGPSGFLNDLLRLWDVVKDDVADLLGPADRRTLTEIWVDFLTSAKGRGCALCGERVWNRVGGMRGHFLERHWIGKVVDGGEREGEE